MKKYDKYGLVSALALTAALVTAPAQATQSYDAKSLEMARQPLNVALQKLSEKFDVQIASFSEDLSGKTVRKLSGQYNLKDALTAALAGSGLYYLRVDDRTIAVGTSERLSAQYQKAGFKVISSNAASDYEANLAPYQDDEKVDEVDSFAFDEIIVTATRRSESLRDVPMAISALGGDAIEKRGLSGFADYLNGVPGVTMADRGAGANTIIIRGISTSPQSGLGSTAGVYLGEVPLADLAGTVNGDSAGNADLKMVDIDRVEVLKGPQGTLFGSASMGGTVRLIPKAPSLDKIEGIVLTQYSNTGESGGHNTAIQGAVNVPVIEDKFALRAVAYRFDDSGYVDNVAADGQLPVLDIAKGLGGIARKEPGVGGSKTTGFRVTGFWMPVDDLSFSLSHIHQNTRVDGSAQVNLGLSGKFQQERLGVGRSGLGTEFQEQNIDVTNLVINYDVGWGELLSSTTRIDHQSSNEGDLSFFYGLIGGQGIAVPNSTANVRNVDSFIQELRFASSFDGPFQFLVGGYYEDKDDVMNVLQTWSGHPELEAAAAGTWLFGAPPPSGVPAGFVWDSFDWRFHVAKANIQKAVFGEFSYDLTDQLKATVGVRHFEYDRKSVSEYVGIGFNGVFENAPKNSGETYRANLSYRPSDDVLLYGQFSQGFRMGGSAPDSSTLVGCLDSEGQILLANGNKVTPPDGALNPDKLDSYEVGAKIALANRRVILNAAAYRINWDGLPVQEVVDLSSLPGCSTGAITLNAGESVSQGIELDAQMMLTENLNANLSFSYGEAKLSGQSSLGNDGDNLPGSADTQVSFGLEYLFDIQGHDAFVRGDYSYVSEFYSNIAETGQASGGYHLVDLTAGISVDGLNISVFVKNLTNDDSLTWVESSFAGNGANRAYRLRPRTIGLSLGYEF
ncbi:TonB-dependent receptor domain-containing protein [Paremcibacter congregatus]|uniref:TonB-dependent receptor domain-containing protein n=1 Tax=Paremcibacter congregatus TaxID=2043170 RepID=UPI003A91493B